MGEDAKVWMPIYIGRFLRDTSGFTAAETGAFVLLILHAWANDGVLPHDGDRLARLARCRRSEFERIWETLKSTGRWKPSTEGLVDDETRQASRRAAAAVLQASNAGRTGAAARWGRGANAMRSHSVRNGTTESDVPIGTAGERRTGKPGLQVVGGDWWSSEAGTRAEGLRLGLEPRAGESWEEFRNRIRASSRKTREG